MTENLHDLRLDLAKFESIPKLENAITFFGSARLKQGSFYYEEAKKLAKLCVEAGFCVITGGGGGVMMGANEGAFVGMQSVKNDVKKDNEEINLRQNDLRSAKFDALKSQNDLRSAKFNALKSIGFNIFLPFEQKSNEFLDYNITFKSLSIRKMALIYKSMAFVIFPGGFGTLDEFIEVLTLRQLGFIKAPIFVLGSEFWRTFDEFIKSSLLKLNVISKGDENLYEISDDLDFIMQKLKEIQ